MIAPLFSEAGPDALPTTIGGYRVVRLLARGPSALTALVHAAGESRVARVFAAATPSDLIDGEVAVHDAIRQADSSFRRHVVELDELVTLPDDRLALLLMPVTGPSLDELIHRRRGDLRLGEAVTVLAPLAAALEAAHAAGITGLAQSTESVRFSGSGAPVIVSVHGARVGPVLPDRFRVLEPEYATDRAALEQLARQIAGAVREAECGQLVALLRDRGRELAHGLFDLAEPVPVDFEASVVGGVPLADARATRPQEDGSIAESSAVAWTRTAESPPALSTAPKPGSRVVAVAIDTLRALGLPAGVIDPIALAALRVGRAAHGVRAHGVRAHRAAVQRGAALRVAESPRPAVRPRFVIAGLSGLIAVIVAVALVAVSASSSGSVSSTAPPPSGAPLEEGVGPFGSPADDAASDAGPDSPETLLHPEPEQWEDIVETLLARWNACRGAIAVDGSASADCAMRVVHAGSAAERLIGIDDPRHAVLERWIADRGDAVVVERMGGAVLVDLVTAGTTTASLLLVRSEAGWRCRDVIG